MILTPILERATDYDVSKYQAPENPIIEEIDVKLAENEKEMLLLELFPNVAATFLRNKKTADYYAKIEAAEEEKRRIEAERKAAYDALPEEVKQEMLLQGLYHMAGDSHQAEEEITPPTPHESKLDLKTIEMLRREKPKGIKFDDVDEES